MVRVSCSNSVSGVTVNPPKMPIHIGDYMRDTGHLRAPEHGAYLMLLFHYWSTGSLPDDGRQLAAIARMSPAEWRRARSIIEPFFDPGWRHGRVEKDLATARASYEAKAKAGAKGGKAKADAKQNPSTATASATAGLKLPNTLNLRPEKKDTDPIGSSGETPRDIRADLFGNGLKTLASITGKTPDSCRSLVGRWLKSANDEAIHVLAAIENAERNRVADPVAWINRALQSKFTEGKPKRTVQDAARDFLGQFGDVPAADGGTTRGDPVRLLPSG